MSGWRLQLRSKLDHPVDGTPIALHLLRGQAQKQIESLPLSTPVGEVTVGDLFVVSPLSDGRERLELQGDLSQIHHLAANHEQGEFIVEGDVGAHLGAHMRGGFVRVTGDAGDHVASPSGAGKVGLSGGRIEIGGNVGNHAGHRMRRGELFVAGDAGDFAASQMVAGTIVVAGQIGRHPAYAMRRGSLISAKLPSLPGCRFTDPLPSPYSLAALILRETPALADQATRSLLQQLMHTRCVTRRGDAAVGGQGELVAPADS